MSNNNLESLAKNLLEKGKSSIPGLDKYMGILESAEGKRLLGQLSASGGESLTDAAKKAADGDSEATKKLIQTIMTSKEGRDLARQIMDMGKG
ncbi:MAG: hypothetical protein FWG36_03715 [Oscillospiraceae bacterium]|nr:hypothetical protein [Oscillospiraceae bacterium]